MKLKRTHVPSFGYLPRILVMNIEFIMTLCEFWIHLMYESLGNYIILYFLPVCFLFLTTEKLWRNMEIRILKQISFEKLFVNCTVTFC